MIYDISFEDSFAEDVSNLALYEVQFTFSVDKAYDRLDAAVDEIEQALRTFPARNPEKPYGFTEALRRKPIDGKYAAFYRIDEGEGIVCVERILHSKADFNRILFGN